MYRNKSKSSKYDSGLSRREMKDIGKLTSKYVQKNKSFVRKAVKFGLLALMAYTSYQIGKQNEIRQEERFSRLEEALIQSEEYEQTDKSGQGSETGNLDNEPVYGLRLQEYFSQRDIPKKEYE